MDCIRNADTFAVTCENMDVPVTTIASMLEPVFHNLTLSGSSNIVRVPVPFNNAKYRVIARVTDFFPHNLEKFSRYRKPSEYEVLSDFEDESCDGEEAPPPHCIGDGEDPAETAKWEWCFALQLEDLSPQGRSKPARVWVYVDNAEAQGLLGLDASK